MNTADALEPGVPVDIMVAYDSVAVYPQLLDTDICAGVAVEK